MSRSFHYNSSPLTILNYLIEKEAVSKKKIVKSNQHVRSYGNGSSFNHSAGCKGAIPMKLQALNFSLMTFLSNDDLLIAAYLSSEVSHYTINKQ